ncbi:MAG: glycosyltransferase family 4 protein [Bryobacterales bacterium]|nr:glycosyltransferase family 4 protein [Bryobacterales bacterium]
MRFSIDAHAVGRKLTGNEVYIRNLMSGFSALDDKSEFIAYVSEPGAEAGIPKGFAIRHVSSNPFVRLGFDLTRRVTEDRPDLLHVQYTAPLACPVPVVVSVHDVSFLEAPHFFPPGRVAQLRLTVSRTIRQAARILTPSEFSKHSIERAYGVDPDRITVTPNAVSTRFRPIAREVALTRLHARFSLPGPYILTVGDLQPRKNQVGLIHAFEELLREHPQIPHHLVLTGQDSWYASTVRRAAQRSCAASRIHFTGFVSDEDLPYLYAGCELFVFPSFYEGFGIPILEAMACSRAVACSNTTAVAEVADGAAILFQPSSTRDMMRAMRDLLLDAELRQRMERLGIARAATFQWRNASERTLAVYYEIVEARARELRHSGVAPVSR